MSYRKLGPHILNSTPQGIAWARVANVVKACDNPDPLRITKPEAICIFRVVDLPDWPDLAVDTILAKLQGFRKPGKLYVEVANERKPYWQFAQLMIMVSRLHLAGLLVALPSWGTGDYQEWEWASLHEGGWAGADAISLHAYWGNEGHTIWHSLRYRQFWRPGDPPLLIAECGRDAVEGGLGGWHKDGISGEQYVKELEAYDAELAKDPHVLGATAFTSGPFPDSKWSPYETDSLPLDLTPAPKPPPGGSVNEYHIEKTIPASNYTVGRTAPLDTIVIHSTRGGAATPEAELQATLNWFRNPASQVSAHLVIAANGDTYFCGAWGDTMYHAKAYNPRSIGIELVQATKETPFPDVQILVLRNAIDWLCGNYGIKHVRGVPGIVGHEAIDTQKSDPGPMFPWDKLGLAATPTPPVDWPLADQLAAAKKELADVKAERDGANARLAGIKAAGGW